MRIYIYIYIFICTCVRVCVCTHARARMCMYVLYHTHISLNLTLNTKRGRFRSKNAFLCTYFSIRISLRYNTLSSRPDYICPVALAIAKGRQRQLQKAVCLYPDVVSIFKKVSAYPLDVHLGRCYF